ncbi:MAG TPA: FG-GAP-like repeat-containing protein [Catalimonadaceae bacterium]|nr:FG-GAP-like repeat-containing protein [Catalimonadaceae bacterium]
MKIRVRFFTLFALLWILPLEKPTQAQSITITSPATTWYVGLDYKIKWTSFALSSDYVNIDYSTNGGSNWINIASHIPNRGADGYIWTIPNTPVAQPWFRIEEFGPTGVNHTFVNTLGIKAPTLNLVTVVAGTTEQPCVQKTITWTESGPAQQVSFELSKDNGASWFPLRYYNGTGYSDGTVPSNPGTNSATILWPEINANLAKIKIKGETGAIVSGTFNLEFNEVPFVRLTKPVGFESFGTGQPIEITWSKTAPSAGIVFSLYAHNENGRTLIEHLVNDEITGSYTWNNTSFSGQHCKIEVNCHQAGECHSSFSPFYFTVSNQPLYSIEKPNGGEILQAGSQFDIEWTSQNVTDPNVNLYISTDNGFTWSIIATDESNDGVFTWTIPNQISSQCRVKVKGSASVGFDESDAVFSILPVAPVPLLFSPVSGPWGTEVTIIGSHLDMVSGIRFNGVTSSITGVNSSGTQLGTLAPFGAATGKIELLYTGGSVFTDDEFVVCGNNVLSTNVRSGQVGTQVDLTGNFFSPVASQNVVLIGGVRANYQFLSPTIIRAIVPAGANSESILVQNLATGASAETPFRFSVTFPSQNSISASDFSPPTEYLFTPGFPAFGAIGQLLRHADIDADGKTDLIVVNQGFLGSPSPTHRIQFYRNNASPGPWTSTSFDPRFEIQDTIRDLEFADLNGDGFPEMLSTSNYRLTIRQNLGTPGTINSSSFGPPVIWNIGSIVEGIAVADFDQDGKPDVAVSADETDVATSATGKIVLLKNIIGVGLSISLGGFNAPINILHSGRWGDLIAADMDQDGKSDLVIGYVGLHVIKNNFACGEILSPLSFTPSYSNPAGFGSGMEAGDLNGDGKPDLLVRTVIGGSPAIGLLENQSNSGNISLGPVVAISGVLTTGNHVPAMGDFDGDGRLDICLTSSALTPLGGVSIRRNKGLGGNLSASSFDPEITLFTKFNAVQGEPSIVQMVADFDMDGKPDIIAMNQEYNSVNSSCSFNLFLNQASLPGPPKILSFSPTYANPGQSIIITGSGFLPQSGNRPAKSTGPSTQSTGPASVQDLARNRVFFGLAEGTVIQAVDTEMVVQVPYGATFDRITVLNESSKLSGTSSQAFTPTYLSVPFFGAGNFADPSTSMRHNSPKGVAMGDLDGDGKADMVVVNNGSASISIYKNLSTPGTLDSAAFQPSFDISVQNDPLDVAVADLNGDGKPEIILCHKASSQVTVLGNEATQGELSAASFPNQQLYFVGDGPVCVKTGDLNGDGRPDIATANFTLGNFSVLENQHFSGLFGSSSFGVYHDYDGDLSECTSISIGQLDNEGGLDIAVTNLNTNTVQVFRNKYHEGVPVEDAFKPGQILPTGTQPQSVKMGDFDGDGRQDLAVACSEVSNPAIVLFQNLSAPGSLLDGSFSEPVPVGLSGYLEELEVADMNGDGRPDLITVEGATDQVYIYPNIHTAGISLQDLNFDNRFRLFVKRLPTDLAVGDLDNDGRPDIVTSNHLHNSVSIIHNNPHVTVTASAGDHGSITPNGTFILSPFSDPEFIIETEAGYEVEEVLVNGEPVLNPALNPFILENLDGNRIIQVTFRLACPEMIFVSAPSNSTFSVSAACQATIAYGVNVTNVNHYSFRLTGATIDSGSGPGHGHSFNVGITHVKIYAYNSCNQFITHEFDITVVDEATPVLTCPSKVVASAETGQTVSLSLPLPTYSDNCQIVNLSWAIQTGFTTTFSAPLGIHLLQNVVLEIGTSTVSYRAEDAAGNFTTCSFQIEVLAVQAPETPLISPGTGTFSGPQMVSILSTTPGSAVYYTTSGNTPKLGTSFTKLYTQPFQILESTTVRAISVSNGFPNSQVATSFISITNPGKAAKPVINPNSGNFDGSVSVSLSTTTVGAQVYYTTNGNTPRFDVPNSFTKLYSVPFTLYNTATVKAIAVAPGIENSAMATANFVVNASAIVATPVFNPAPGNYSSPVSLTITSATAGAAIYYTTNGNVPRLDVPNSFTKLYSGPVPLESSCTVRAMAVKTGLQPSATAAGVYTFGVMRIAVSEPEDEPALWYESSSDPGFDVYLSVYPNPGEGKFTLSVPGPPVPARLQLVNLLGQDVWNGVVEPTESTKEIDIRDQPAGIYTLVYQSNGLRKTLKIVKQ